MPADTESLAKLLATASAPTLSPEETDLIRTALAHLATSQSLIARYQALLESYASDTADIEAATANALDAAHSSITSNSPLSSYNAPGARAARAQLLDQLDSAASLDRWLEIILNFVTALALPTAP